MSNDFFDSSDYTELARLDVARAEDVNDIAAAIVAGFDLLPSKSRMYEGRVTYCGDSAGTANAQTVSIPYAATLTDGLHLRIKVGFTNTGALTLDATPAGGAAFGAINVADFGGNLLTGGEVIAGTFLEVIYHSGSSHFRIMNPNFDVGTVTTFDINALTTGTDVDPTADYAAIFDASAGAMRKVLTGLIANEYDAILRSQFNAGA